MPAAAIASVISADRSGPAAFAANLSVPSCRWMPSATNSQVTPCAPSSAKTGPGARWCGGGMPLKTWVPTVAPAATAARACSYVASVCPTATVTPAPTSSPIASIAPGNSGAMVTIRTVPRPASTSRRSSSVEGSRRYAGFCAPQRACDRYGPS